MRVHAAAASVSWIPTDSLTGPLKKGMDLRVSRYDQPPPERVEVPEGVLALRDADAMRFANVLAASAEFDGDRVVDAAYDADSGLAIGVTTARIGRLGVTFRAVGLPDIQREPVVEQGPAGASVRFVQTVGGRTGAPIPRPVPHPPFVRWQAPIVWTTLALTLRADGSSSVDLTGASAFPRHWVYDSTGEVRFKSGLTDQARWMAHSFGVRTPWASHDRDATVVEVESALERELSADIMRGGRRPEIRHVAQHARLTRQGETGDELYLLLDGVVRVDVDDKAVVELGPGAVIGERALLEGGTRTSTVTALTPLRVAVAAKDAVDLDRLRALADTHHREDT